VKTVLKQAYKFRPKPNWESEAKAKIFFAQKAKRSEATKKAKRSEQSELFFQNWDKIETLNFAKRKRSEAKIKRSEAKIKRSEAKIRRSEAKIKRSEAENKRKYIYFSKIITIYIFNEFSWPKCADFFIKLFLFQ